MKYRILRDSKQVLYHLKDIEVVVRAKTIKKYLCPCDVLYKTMRLAAPSNGLCAFNFQTQTACIVQG